MIKVHQKGFLLIELSKVTSMWDDDLIDKTLLEYNLIGDYWKKNLRVALDELSAAGVITRIDEKLVDINGKSRLFFCYKLSAFGRLRLIDTGLIDTRLIIEGVKND
ncbi:MAG: hypothetical protein WBP13_02070 [Methylophilaceae bacterium]